MMKSIFVVSLMGAFLVFPATATNGGTKGKKRWDFGAGDELVRITKGC
ncbi:hypothetical protein [Nonomuraea jiangxiensis]|uniref:Uncharacterized protein n=1 Tax=Nonomuraea jiangxiensis TaxID=633440 RepID=A0A1G9Q9T9_9ACTN|nr:hypothetical protein [Nonomuraea jiangxiensis]SDM07776.1 hypothetical protein SAMN05421869_135102 [Nonomuraea jiangxiensis]